jgi:hypothetical protein
MSDADDDVLLGSASPPAGFVHAFIDGGTEWCGAGLAQNLLLVVAVRACA